MSDGYRTSLFEAYGKRTNLLDGEAASRRDWFGRYVARAYAPVIRTLDRTSTEVLEIGCGKGMLVGVLRDLGFVRLTGIDLSPDDIADARRLEPNIEFVSGDAFQFLARKPAAFDMVILKAVLEHIPKDQAIPLLSAIRESLRPGGIAIVDVPNMDWLFAPHERYMDFTHEVGYTRESLIQVLGDVFGSVTVTPTDNDLSRGMARSRVRLSRAVVGTLLRWADPESTDLPIWERSLVGVGRR